MRLPLVWGKLVRFRRPDCEPVHTYGPVAGFFDWPSPRHENAPANSLAPETAIDMMGGMTDRQTKITFGEMREMGVRGLLIYCADYRCSHSSRSAAMLGPMMPDCPISRSASPVGSAASAAQT